MLRAHLQEGLFADPAHGGNRDKLGWRFLGHPGVWLENSAEENLSDEPVTKGGEIRSLEDVDTPSKAATCEPGEIPGYDPQSGAEPPDGPADVVLVGLGAVGALVAPILARAGLRVVGSRGRAVAHRARLRAGRARLRLLLPGRHGPEVPQRDARAGGRNEGEPTREATFSLGRMMNGVGGSVIHWGGALRRCHPHHFRYRTHVRESFGEGVLPEGCTLADWPVSYDDLEPYYTAVEYLDRGRRRRRDQPVRPAGPSHTRCRP